MIPIINETMDDPGSDFMLNLVSDASKNAKLGRNNKSKLSKDQRMFQRRQEKRQFKRDAIKEYKEERKKLFTSKDDKSSPQKRKREAVADETGSKETDSKRPKHQKFSSLFKSNPSIPQVGSLQVDSISETVFTSNKFGDLDLHPHLISNLEKRMELSQMTSVQQATIPHALAGKDLMVKSQTGSGKTLSYAVAVVQQLQSIQPKLSRSDGTHAVVIVPTRELAIQSFEAFQKVLHPFQWLVPGMLMGGEKKKAEKARLRKGITILIGTPGRLLDHILTTQSLALDKVRWLVIDEADRLLDMGFEKEVSQIVKAITSKCAGNLQTVLLSATLSAGVEELAGMSLKSPVKIDISDDNMLLAPKTPQNADKTENETYATPTGLQHLFMIVPTKLRLVTLAAFLLHKCKFSRQSSKVIIFFSTQDSVEFYHQILQNILCSVDDSDDPISSDNSLMFYKLHGDMLQKDRTKVFHDFCDKKGGILLCTDVAARGLDLPHVKWIIQFNAPGNPTDYIHRAGRTARIGSQGNALLFLMPSEVKYIPFLQKYKISLTELQMDDTLKILLKHSESLPRGDRTNPPTTTEESATRIHNAMEKYVQENVDMRTLARKAYQSFIRSYATYPSNMKSIFHVKFLHLGHTAKSYALQDAPGHIGSIISNNAQNFRKSNAKKHKGVSSHKYHYGSKKEKFEMSSEFASGIGSNQQSQQPKQKKRKKKPGKK